MENMYGGCLSKNNTFHLKLRDPGIFDRHIYVVIYLLLATYIRTVFEEDFWIQWIEVIEDTTSNDYFGKSLLLPVGGPVVGPGGRNWGRLQIRYSIVKSGIFYN